MSKYNIKYTSLINSLRVIIFDSGFEYGLNAFEFGLDAVHEPIIYNNSF